MNSQHIIDILQPVILKKKVTNFASITNIEISTELSRKGTLLFYNLTDTENSQKLFKKRISKCKYSLVITNKFINGVDNLIAIDKKDIDHVQKLLCDIFYPFERSLFTLVGVTGTNGKSSVVHYCSQLCEQLSINAYSIGTLGVFQGKKKLTDNNFMTTPSYVDLRKILSQINSSRHEFIFMEVSSHSLDQNRLNDIKMDYSLWTNISQDHLDYHKSMNDYFRAKRKLFAEFTLSKGACFISNNDDLKKKLSDCKVRVKNAKVIKENLQGMLNLSFNKRNIELATTCVEKIFNKKFSTKELNQLKPPLGRTDLVIKNNIKFVIDYAHTPEGLRLICSEISKIKDNSKLRVVFGCGGNRDKSKRLLMAKAVSEYADVAYVTSDNPRDEDPEEILKDILPGISIKYFKNIDRKLTIKKAFLESSDNDYIIIAGKGHEQYQEIRGKKYKYSDYQVINEI